MNTKHGALTHAFTCVLGVGRSAFVPSSLETRKALGFIVFFLLHFSFNLRAKKGKNHITHLIYSYSQNHNIYIYILSIIFKFFKKKTKLGIKIKTKLLNSQLSIQITPNLLSKLEHLRRKAGIIILSMVIFKHSLTISHVGW